MPKMSPQDAQAKYASRLKGSTSEITKGIDRVTEAPGVKAAAKKDKMKQHLIEKIDDGTWERRVASVSLESWKAAAKNKGVGRIAAGVDQAATKMTAFFTELFPYQEGGQAKLATMPDMTIDDSINRQAFWTRYMAGFKRSS